MKDKHLIRTKLMIDKRQKLYDRQKQNKKETIVE